MASIKKDEKKEEEKKISTRQNIFDEALAVANKYQSLHNEEKLYLTFSEEEEDESDNTVGDSKESQLEPIKIVDSKLVASRKPISRYLFINCLYYNLAWLINKKKNQEKLDEFVKNKKDYNGYLMPLFTLMLIAFLATFFIQLPGQFPGPLISFLTLTIVIIALYFMMKRDEQSARLKKIKIETQLGVNLLATSLLVSSADSNLGSDAGTSLDNDSDSGVRVMKMEEVLLSSCQYLSCVYIDSVRYYGEEDAMYHIKDELKIVQDCLPKNYNLFVEVSKKSLTSSWFFTKNRQERQTFDEKELVVKIDNKNEENIVMTTVDFSDLRPVLDRSKNILDFLKFKSFIINGSKKIILDPCLV
jgi:hypothetical protein